MFIGHFAVGFAGKRAAPELGLGTLFLSAQLLDLVWPVLVLTGIERVRVDHSATLVTPLAFEYYPWSHSLLLALLWGGLLGLALRLVGRSRHAALLAGAVVVSHWLLDWLTHAPDLPLSPAAETRVGLGLWNSLPATLLVEVALFVAGLGVYAYTTRPVNRQGRWGLWGLVVFLVLVHALNVFGSKPPEGTPSWAVAGPALAMWLLVGWAYWVDRNRCPRRTASQPIQATA